MKLTIRVGDTMADLQHFNRVSIERIWNRSFLVGVRTSGRVMALFAVRPNVASATATVSEAIHATIGSKKTVCVLTQELVRIDDDEEAMRCIRSHNAALADDGRDPLDVPNTPAGNVVEAAELVTDGD